MPEKSTPAAIRDWFAAHEQVRDVVLNLFVALIAWGLAELVLLPRAGGTPVTPMWPSAGFTVAVVFLGGYRLLPGVMLGSFAFNVTRSPIYWAAILGAVQTIQPWLDTRLLRTLKFDPRLERTRDALILSLVVAPIGALVVALASVTLELLSGLVAQRDFIYELTLWWLRDWLGVMIVTTLIFAWRSGRATVWTRGRIAEAAALLLVLLVGSQLMFGLWGLFATRYVPIAFIFFPLVMWAGLRFGARGSATTVAGISLFAMAIAALGIGPFATFPVQFTQFLLFAFLALGSITGQFLAAIMAERDDALE